MFSRSFLRSSLLGVSLASPAFAHAQATPPVSNSSAQTGAQTAPATSQPTPVVRDNAPTQPADEIAPLYRRDQTARITATARAVVLDVTVVDAKGKPVTGLKPSDFQLLEDTLPQKFDSFEEHTATDPAIAAKRVQPAKLPPNTFTDFVPTGVGDALTVILLDAANTQPSTQAYARDQLIRFMKTIPAGYPVAIFQMDTRLHMLQGFTTDPDALRAAVEGNRDSVRLPLVPPYLQGYVATRYRLDTLQNGMRAMARYLSAFPGRKNLVWFTGSVPGSYWDVSSPFPEIEDYQEELNSATETLALSRVSLYPVDARGLETDPAFSASHRGAESIGSMNSFTTRRFYDHSAMDQMAQDTGGVAFYNTNGLKQALQRVVDTGSFYYTMSYTPTNKVWDGKYRKIRIELANSLQGLRVQYRQGYYARPPSVVQVHQAQRKKQAKPATTDSQGAVVPSGARGSFLQNMQLGAVPPTELTFELSVSPGTRVEKLDKAPAPEGNQVAKSIAGKPLRNLHLMYFVDSRGVQFSKNPDNTEHASLQFVALLFNDQGELQNSMETTLQLDLKPDVYAKVKNTGFKTRMDLAVPEKGNYFVRAGVHDMSSDRAGVLEIPLEAIDPDVAGMDQTLVP